MSPAAPARPSSPISGSPSSGEVLEQLERLLRSRRLRESQQLQAFLEYIVRETLESRQDGLKEYRVGCIVFGRKPDYDPRHDGIVRVQATTLRKRLEMYYAEEGIRDRVRIELPRGGYVPSFQYCLVEAPVEVPPVFAPAPAPVTNRRPLVLSFLLGSVLTGVLCFALLRGAKQTAPFHVT
jgi:hypothetical protein